MSAQDLPAEGGIRYCFTDHRLSAVVLLNEDGSCDTPSCHWTSTAAPLALMEFVKIGMTMYQYMALCGMEHAIKVLARMKDKGLDLSKMPCHECLYMEPRVPCVCGGDGFL